MQTNKLLATLGLAAASLLYASCGSSGTLNSKKRVPDHTANIDEVMTNMANAYLGSDSTDDPIGFVGGTPDINPEAALQWSIADEVGNTFMRLPTRTCGYTHFVAYFEKDHPGAPQGRDEILVGNPQYNGLVREARQILGRTNPPLTPDAGRIETYNNDGQLILVITGDTQEAQLNALEALMQAFQEVDGFFDPKIQKKVTIKKFGDAHSVDVRKEGGQLYIDTVK